MDPNQPSLAFSPDLKRSRLTVFFRPLLVIPHFVWLYLYTIGAMVMFIGHWLVAVFTGRTPRSTYDFLVAYVSYVMRLQSYVLYLTNDYPPFNGHESYAVATTMPEPRQAVQGRASSFFRDLLAIPALFVSLGYGIATYATTFLAWFAIMVTGRMPAGFQRFGERAMNYSEQLACYRYLLVKTYPRMIDPSMQITVEPAAGGGKLVTEQAGSPFL